jgi:hypothetical protein
VGGGLALAAAAGIKQSPAISNVVASLLGKKS